METYERRVDYIWQDQNYIIERALITVTLALYKELLYP